MPVYYFASADPRIFNQTPIGRSSRIVFRATNCGTVRRALYREGWNPISRDRFHQLASEKDRHYAELLEEHEDAKQQDRRRAWLTKGLFKLHGPNSNDRQSGR